MIMDNIVNIWDIHWTNIWEKIAEKEKDADKIVFIWDYFDSYDLSWDVQLENFQRILDFKKKNRDKVDIILWNHELNYILDGKDWSSWYNIGHNEGYSEKIKNILEENIKEFKVVTKIDDILFSHAWFSNTWIERTNHLNLDLENNFEEEINNLFMSTYKNEDSLFNYYWEDRSNKWNNINQWPFWIRPESLSKDWIEGLKQVVWHSYVNRGQRLRYKEEWLYFTDNFVSHFWDENNERSYYLKIIKKGSDYTFKEELI